MPHDPPSMPERPLECSECKRPIAVWYTELYEEEATELAMCRECPILKTKLQGEVEEGGEQEPAGLCCGNCGTSLESVRVGSPLGCSECYTVFGDVLTLYLMQSEWISRRLKATPATHPLHVGREPGEIAEISPQLQLVTLTEALDETLHKEDYEQAAWLRDQIKQLEEKLDEGQSN